jgi:beta-glucanase (GH16 family)
LVSLESNKAIGGLIVTHHGQKVYTKVDLNFKPSGYVIVGIEWSPKKIEWKVNERSVGSITQNIPHEKLALRIETEVVKQTSNLPHRLDIDWIKCYQRNT